jgi:hypothetical protein
LVLNNKKRYNIINKYKRNNGKKLEREGDRNV